MSWPRSAVGCLASIVIGSATAQENTRDALVAVRRTVLALSNTYQSDRNSPELDIMHNLVQLPLNFLGMRVLDFGLADGPPSDVDMGAVRAIVLWLAPERPTPRWLLPWLEQQVDRHDLKIVHLGALAPLGADHADGTERLKAWLERFDCEHIDGAVNDPTRIEVTSNDLRRTAYEGPSWGPMRHAGPRSYGEQNDIWLTTHVVKERDRTPVVTGPWGGIALQPWAVRIGGPDDDRRWHVDPFRFFRRALDLAGVPAPDPCVLHGRRVFFLHVDGDGFESESTVVEGQSAARVFLDQVVDRYALPMTISVIVAGLTDDFEGATITPRMKLAREILTRPNVEAASHSVLHPMNWRRRLTKRTPARTVTWYPEMRNYDHDMDAEVRRSMQFVDRHLLDPGKRCELMLWSGNANPHPSALREVAKLGRHNLNGGVYRWDALHDSVGFVQPWGKRLDDAFQVYCGAANENIFEGYFTTMPGAFGYIDQTIENTGRERILKPANLYVHFYGAERPLRLRAMQRLIERWAFEEETCAIYASRYARAVESAQFGCNIEAGPTDERGRVWNWRFDDVDDCTTFRLDDEDRHVDWVRSRGIRGARRLEASLFVDVEPDGGELVLSARPVRRAHVITSNHPLHAVRLEERGVTFESRAPGERRILCGGFAPGDIAVLTTADGVDPQRVVANGRGEIEITLPAADIAARVRLRAR